MASDWALRQRAIRSRNPRGFGPGVAFRAPMKRIFAEVTRLEDTPWSKAKTRFFRFLKALAA